MEHKKIMNRMQVMCIQLYQVDKELGQGNPVHEKLEQVQNEIYDVVAYLCDNQILADCPNSDKPIKSENEKSPLLLA